MENELENHMENEIATGGLRKFCAVSAKGETQCTPLTLNPKPQTLKPHVKYKDLRVPVLSWLKGWEGELL